METLSDIALVTQVAVMHNKRAFDQLVRKYQSPVRRFLLNLTLGNDALADDLAQDTFIKAYHHIGQFRAVASFQTWLFRIAYNTFYDYRRVAAAKNMSAMADIGDYANVTADSRNTAIDSDLKTDIYQALSLLREEERTCVTLQMIDGLSIEQITRITGIGENTVKSHLRRGKDKLVTFLKNNGYD